MPHETSYALVTTLRGTNLHSRSGLTSATRILCALPAVESGTTDPAPEKKKTRVLSGVQPSGSLTLGNYLGAIRQWVDLQDDYETYFCVVDLHAITAPHDPKKLKEETLSAAAIYLAAGVDPEKSRVFIQSHVKAHSELCWLLNTQTPMNWLERMIQYKEKSSKQGENVNVGLFDYPVLMAADILLYQAGKVPVGEDQRQHLELTRDICRRFNDIYAKKKKRHEKPFREPEAMIVKEGARVMSLTDGTSKMSKSAENENSRINLLDPPDIIKRKIKKCKTDAFDGLEWDNPDRPEAANLLTIYQATSGLSREAVLAEVSDMRWGAFKPILTEAVVEHLRPLQTRYADLMVDKSYLNSVLIDGAKDANLVADQTLRNARSAMGFLESDELLL
eukprot:CAMPEP_0185765822 /NCGR_PEP_ID=MMETSP1174-20130828/33073_1 /TAXON_ID=35687 /ORGANISM="Dictyocha speculum, Strain CCMP1381" /LENGTH=390 /DNA_ID=CAMNT_0028449191 /DNA_START=139 /DNA_END=1312 /DNA_ORIENTATION=+